MKHFNNVTTIEEARKIYRELAKQHHPDKGGDVEIMKAINNEYDYLTAKILKGENLNTEDFNEAWENSQLFKEKINSIINCEGLIIEIVGLWVWVTGATKNHKDTLKAAGYFFASKKLAWYWRPASAGGGRGKYNLDQLKQKYGCQKVEGKSFNKIV